MRHACFRRGFTLVEAMLVMGLFALIVAGSVPFLGNFRQTQQTQTSATDIVEIIRRAQHRSMSREDGRDWGVRVLSGSVVLYAGSSYAARDQAFDEAHIISSPSSLSGITDIQFSARGFPSAAGTLTVSHPSTVPRTIDVTAGGGVFLHLP